MTIKQLMERYPDQFAEYAEKILDSYFGNISVFYRNEKVLYVNKRMAASVKMTKEEFSEMPLKDLRAKKLWLRSVSQEMYTERHAAFNAYNVSKWGDELFTHVEPIFNDQGELLMSVQFSIPKQMLTEFSQYLDQEKTSLQNYKDIADYLRSQRSTEQIICESPTAQMIFKEARHLGRIDSTVLLCGETGTGKDVLANFIYQNSKRAEQAFIPVNCSAIPSELVESELFGYDRGAFTGARNSGKPGLFEMADHGTLFLDEVGELPIPVQAKLLRVLETGDIMRVGGTKQIHTDVRVIAATNRDLSEMVKQKKFRQDLFYRLNVMPVLLPPLRDRTEDILPLSTMFLTRYNRKYGMTRILSRENQETLLEYQWPGNIRELRNVIEHYVISGRLDITAETTVTDTISLSDTDLEPQEKLPLHEACEQFERAYICRAMDECGGNVAKAAERLGIHRSLLYKKLNKWS